MFLRRYILLLLTFLSLGLQAQQYPVDVQVFVTPPYPQSLRGYADTFEQKIQAHFLLKDLSTGGRPFALRFSLENFQGQTIAQTPDYITPYLVNLSPGVRRTLTNIDFKTLLRYENLYGINEATYNGLLPEGTYFIGLSLYDVATGRPVSNKGRAMIQVRRYSPPVLTMPQKGEVLTKKNAFQHIVFQWMPRDVAPFMQYEFTLKEVWDLALVPEEAFMTGRLVYQTKTFSPALAYTNMMPILLENKRYVWQVRAFTNNPNNPNEQSYFKNNGNSETFYFDLVSHCEAPKFLTAITESTSAQLRWSAQAMMPNQEYPYKVMYREKGKTWKSQKVSMPYAKVTGLKRGRTYIYKVGVACGLETAYSSSVFGEESYMYSTEQEFTTTEQIDEKSQVQCGVKPEIRIKNTNPLQDNLYANTTFTAGDFPVTVLNATGNNGVYSGEGYVKVPYLQDTKIKVVFNGIKLNTERQLIDGKLVTTYDETERNVVEVPIIKTLSDAINSLKNVGKQQEEIVQNQEKLEKQLSENKIDKEEYDKKTKENISQWEKTLSVYNDVESFTEKHPLITKEEVNELKELQQQKSFAGNSVGKKDLENTKKINARQTEILSKIAQREQSAIADIKQYLEDFVHESTNTSTTHCKEWKKAKGGIGKIGQYNLDYIEYQECTNGTMYKAKGGVFYFFHTQYNVYANALSQDHDKEYFYVYEPNSQKWERFFPDFREFKRAPMPDELRNFLFTVVDYIIPIESGYILITGKNFEGEERSRLVAGTSLVIEAGLTFTVVGKGFYKAGKGVLKAGKNATTAIVKSKKVLKGSAKELEVTTEVVVKNAGEIENLINKALIQELKGVKFTEENLKFITKNVDGIIIFLEKGSTKSGLEHIIKGKWNGKIDFQDLFNGKIEEMVENMYKAIKNEKYIKKIIDSSGRISYIYKIQTTKGLREFKIAVGSNGYIVTFFPNW